MGKLEFHSNDAATLGIELELALVDDRTLGLSSSVRQVLEKLPDGGAPFFKPELMQCCVEINTDICRTVDDARADLEQKLLTLEEITDRLALRVWWGATHPFSLWADQEVTPNERYHNLVNLLQEMARRLVTFGLHVHVGVDSGDKAVLICNHIMQHLPTLLALSCSSPCWENRVTGLLSNRSIIMGGLPTAGLPTLMRNWSEYVWLVNHMVDTGFINSIREIWWEVRPHHNFGTVEVRVCDMPGNLDDALTIAALVQCLVQAISDQIDAGSYQRDWHPMMVRQNEWRACRFGIRAQLVNSYTHEVQSVSGIVEYLIDRLRPTAEALGCLSYLEHAQAMADGPTWAERQLAILEETGDPAEVVRRLTEQSRVTPRRPKTRSSAASA